LRTIICLAGCVVLACVAMATAQPGSLGSSEVFFSTPTINDAVPSAFAGGLLTASAVVTAEDDWRQFEFVAARFRPQMEAELRSIDEIWTRHSVRLAEGTVFRKVHVRKLIPAPLSIPFSRAELSALFEGQPAPFALRGHSRPLRDVHAVRCGGLTFYGEILDGRLRTLGLDLDAKPPLQKDAAARLESFVRKNGLLLVHWPSRKAFASPEAAMRYLRGHGG
jgi:hypothetical protein